MDLSTIMNPAAIPPGTFGLLFAPAALLAVWSGLVVVVLAGLTAVLGMESSQEPADRGVAPTPHLASRVHLVERAAA